MEERWREIKGLGGDYLISEKGVVKSLKWGKEKILSPSIKRDGYVKLTIGTTGNNTFSKTFNIQRLVAETFIPNPHNKEQVNHIDGNKLNNSVVNLEWCSRRENMDHAIKNGLTQKGAWKSNHLPVLTIRSFALGKQTGNAKKLAEKYSKATSTIARIKRGGTANLLPTCSLEEIAKEKEACTWKDEFYE